MAKIKLTKGELKRQRDALRQYQRYLPTLQLKKQQLQIEILHQQQLLEQKRQAELTKRKAIDAWSVLLADPYIDISPWFLAKGVSTLSKNVAGVDIPVFDRVSFGDLNYDLFVTPHWIDTAIEAIRDLIATGLEARVIEEGAALLKHELRITTQRVNLFEKVKIPEAEEAIRLIKIYIGDQMTNAVGRSKIAKKKIEEAELEEVAV
jgi:V/A-type H+-transporting ATPase subunit D